MYYWFVIRAGGEILSADETEMLTDSGEVMARYTPAGGAATPFRSLLAAYRAIRGRRSFLPTGRYREGSWSIRKGLGYGYIIEWVADQTMPSGSPVKLTYEVIPTPRY